MRQRIYGAAAVAILILAGYLSTSASAQVEAIVAVGDHFSVSFGDGSDSCTVAGVRGTFIRCEGPKPSAFSQAPEEERWLNLLAARSLYRRIQRK